MRTVPASLTLLLLVGATCFFTGRALASQGDETQYDPAIVDRVDHEILYDRSEGSAADNLVNVGWLHHHQQRVYYVPYRAYSPYCCGYSGYTVHYSSPYYTSYGYAVGPYGAYYTPYGTYYTPYQATYDVQPTVVYYW